MSGIIPAGERAMVRNGACGPNQPRKGRVPIRKRSMSADVLKTAYYFFATENVMSPTASIIKVMGQGRGSPSGFGLFRIIRVESAMRSAPEMIKHIFAIFITTHLALRGNV